MVIALCLYKVLIAIFHVIQITQINQQYCVLKSVLNFIHQLLFLHSEILRKHQSHQCVN